PSPSSSSRSAPHALPDPSCPSGPDDMKEGFRATRSQRAYRERCERVVGMGSLPRREGRKNYPGETALAHPDRVTALAGDRQIGDMRLKPDLSDWDEPLPVGRDVVRAA